MNRVSLDHRHLGAVAIVVAALLITGVAPARAEHAGTEAERAAAEILDAREQANAAAQAMFDAESRLDTLTIDLERKSADVEAAELAVDQLRQGLTEHAVRRFTGAAERPMLLLTDLESAYDDAAKGVYASAATGSELVRADELEAALERLDDEREALASQRDETEQARNQFEQRQADAEALLEELQRIEAERLQDALVEHELERQRQERLAAERREQERLAAERAEQERREQAAREREEQQQRDQQNEAPNAPAGAGDGTAEGDGAAAPSDPGAGAGLVCPIAGPRSFADTWGAPRSGGRSHEGVDMMSPGGTPLVAVEAGTASFRTNRLGGNTISLQGASGTRYYYAHLSSWEGSSRSVSKGEIIGYVGATGNTSANHLHLHVHPNNGVSVNPYPYVRAVC